MVRGSSVINSARLPFLDIKEALHKRGRRWQATVGF